MSERRETTLNDSPVAASPATKRESFHWPKYSLIVGTITTSAVKASDGAGCHALPASSSSVAYLSNVSLAARSRFGSGRTSPNSVVPSPSRSTGVPAWPSVLGQRAPERALGEVEEVPGLLQHGAVRERQVERDGALGILCGARAGVEDDVVLGERRRPGDDPLDALVVRVALDPGRLHLLRGAGRPRLRFAAHSAARSPSSCSRQVGVLRGQLVELVVKPASCSVWSPRKVCTADRSALTGSCVEVVAGLVSPPASSASSPPQPAAGTTRPAAIATRAARRRVISRCTGASLHKPEPAL